MDPFTHAVLGGAISQALFQKQLGRRAFILGAAGALLPDIDIFIRFDQWSAWKYHRGFTHSLFFPFLVAPALAIISHRFALWRDHRYPHPARAPGDYHSHMLVLYFAILSHPLLDWATNYGTQLLTPLSDHRFALNAMAVIDPMYTLPLLFSAIIGWIYWRRNKLVAWTARWGLLISSLIVFAGWGLNERTKTIAIAELAVSGFSIDRVNAYPSIFQPFLRRVTAFGSKEVRVGYYTFLSDNPINWSNAERKTSPEIERLKSTEAAALLNWFALGQVHYRQSRDKTGNIVEAHDMRFGAPGTGDKAFWGIKALFDKDGEIIDGPNRFRIATPVTTDTLKRLYFAVIGDPRGTFKQ